MIWVVWVVTMEEESPQLVVAAYSQTAHMHLVHVIAADLSASTAVLYDQLHHQVYLCKAIVRMQVVRNGAIVAFSWNATLDHA